MLRLRLAQYAAAGNGSPAPTYNFMGAALPTGATLARADATTCATRVNSAGVLVTAAANVARFTYDPVTHGLQGLLNEQTDTNAVINSSALTGTGWTPDATTITDNAQASPDGTTNAATVKEDATTAAHDARYSALVSFSAGLNYPASAFVKNISGSRWFQFCIASAHAINFNPTTGALGSTIGIFTAGAVQQFPNGWWRLTGTYASTTTGSSGFRQALVTASNSVASQSYAGDNISTLAITGIHWGLAGAPLGTYIATAGSAVTRAADVLTLACANGTYTVLIQRLSGVTTLTGQVVSGGAGFVVPTDPSPVQRVTLLRVA